MEVVRDIQGVAGPVGAYSTAVKSGGFVFCAGQIGRHPKTGELVQGGIEAQTQCVIENLQGVLKASGTSFDHVVMTTIFLSDITFGKVVNEIYGRAVSKDAPPARQTVAVKDLPLGALVEISVIAELP